MGDDDDAEPARPLEHGQRVQVVLTPTVIVFGTVVAVVGGLVLVRMVSGSQEWHRREIVQPL